MKEMADGLRGDREKEEALKDIIADYREIQKIRRKQIGNPS